MNQPQLEALRRLLDYVRNDEERDFETCEEGAREKHIYNDIRDLDDFVAGAGN